MIDLLNVATPPWEEDLLVAAAPGGLVDVWSLTRAERIATFETVWGSGGGWRGALVPGERSVVVAGAWERHGVCGYDLSGERLWQERRPPLSSLATLPSRISSGAGCPALR